MFSGNTDKRHQAIIGQFANTKTGHYQIKQLQQKFIITLTILRQFLKKGISGLKLKKLTLSLNAAYSN